MISKPKPDKCVKCHGENEKTDFCDECHHGTRPAWEYKSEGRRGQQQHPQAVAAGGVEGVHREVPHRQVLRDCHSKSRPYRSRTSRRTGPSRSSGRGDGLRQAARAGQAIHALERRSRSRVCAICHGEGGPNAKYCKGCHSSRCRTRPSSRSTTERQEEHGACQNCHQFHEVCSNCHHIDSSLTTPWIRSTVPR